MKRVTGLVVAGVVISGLVAGGGSAFAAKGGGGGGRGGGGGGGGGYGGGGQQMAPQVNPAIAIDQTALNAAQSDYAKAASAVDAQIKTLQKDFETNADTVAAKKSLEDAVADQGKARDAAMAKLKSDAAYKAAAAKEQAANDKVASLQKKHASQDQINDAASDALKLGGATSKMETDALSSDADYTAAKGKVADAKKAYDDLRTAFTDSLKTNTDLAPLQANKDAAQQKVADAQAKLKSDSSVAMH